MVTTSNHRKAWGMPGKTVLITGASSGMGKATAEKLIADGYSGACCGTSRRADARSRRIGRDRTQVGPVDDGHSLQEVFRRGAGVLTCEHLLRRVWGSDGDADVPPMRTSASAIQRKLGDDAYNPTDILTELRVGYRMPMGQGHGNRKGTSDGTGHDA